MSIRRSLGFSFLEKYASTAINLASTLVLARLLTPAEIGVFSVGAAVVGILHTLRDFGITNYLIQEREVDREKIRTAFTMTLALSWFFAAALLLGSDWAATFYREDGIREIVWVMVVNFFLIPFGSPILALMRRDMQFGRLAVIQLVSTATNAFVAIVLAASGYGFMSLAWASLAGVAMTSGLAFLMSPRRFLLRPGLNEWRSVLAFGSYASTSALVADLRNTAPDLILGRMLGFEAVGLYSRALGLLSIFNRLIMDGLYPVLLPAFSSRVREGAALRPYYLQGLEYITGIYWPFLVFISFTSETVIIVLLGQQWVEAAPLVWPLCCAMGLGVLSFMHQPILISLGQIKYVLVINAFMSAVSILLVVAGSAYSLTAVALLAIPSSSISAIFIFGILRKFIHVSVLDILKSVRKSSLVLMITTSAVALLTAIPFGRTIPPFLSLAIIGSVFGAVWLAAIFATNHPIKDEIRLGMSRLGQALRQRRLGT